MKAYLPGLEEPELSAELSQWYTPPRLAADMVRWGLRFAPVGSGARVLEPSCGGGAIVNALLRLTSAAVVAVDVDAKNVTPWGETSRVEATQGDFLDMRRSPGFFRHAFMNPPYEHGQDVRHVLHALSMSSAVTALVRSAVLHVRRAEAIWPHVRAVAALVGRPSFDGPERGSPLSDFALVHLASSRRSRGVPMFFSRVAS